MPKIEKGNKAMKQNKGTNKGTNKDTKNENRKEGKTMKKITNENRKSIMLTAHKLCNHGKSMKWGTALKTAWKAFKSGCLESVASVEDAMIYELEKASETRLIEKIAHKYLTKLVRESKSMQDENGEQVDNELSISAQKAFYHYGFYGFENESYRDFIQNIALATTKLIRKTGYIEEKNQWRIENGYEPLTIVNLLWNGASIGWNLTVKQIVNRMRKSAKNHEYEYFNVDSIDKTNTDESGNLYNPYDSVDAESVKGQYGFSDKIGYWMVWDAIKSVCKDEKELAIVAYRKNGNKTQKQTADYMGLCQQNIARTLKQIAERYHAI